MAQLAVRLPREGIRAGQAASGVWPLLLVLLFALSDAVRDDAAYQDDARLDTLMHGHHAMEDTAGEGGDAVDIFLRSETAMAAPDTLPTASMRIAVKPLRSARHEGLGSLLQHYRKSLSYALALGLPWLGQLPNDHDGIDYTEYLGLCQPLCTNRSDLGSFDKVVVPTSAVIDLTTGRFEMLEGIQRPTVLLISEMDAHRGDLDEGHTKYLTSLRDRFMRYSMPMGCPTEPYLTFHFRWGDVKTNDYDHPEGRAMAMSTAAAIIKRVQEVCSLGVKLMSEGPNVGHAFATRFSGAFEYLDGLQSRNLSNALQTFACSTVLIGGVSSFTVLGALLSHNVVIAPKASVKYRSLDYVVDPADILSTTHVSAPDLDRVLRKVASDRPSCSRQQ